MAETSARGRYAAVMTLIGSGHALSHFYVLALPPLFPLLKADFGVSYAALGLLVSLFNLVTGVFQVPAGVLVDRLGARNLLAAGLAILGICFAGIAVAPSYWMVLVLISVAGIGGSIFHPADYAIITGSVEEKRLGRAFGLHTFTGSAGIMAAPLTMTLLTASFGWRPALLIVALLSFAVLACLYIFGGLLRDERSVAVETQAGPAKPESSAGVLLSAPILTMFAFYVFVAMVGGGMQTFAPTVLVTSQGTELETANLLLTVFLVASAGGILLGGQMADRTRRHGLTAALAMVASAVLIVIVGGFSLPAIAVGLSFGAMGLLQGVIRPARDLMVRAVTPPGAAGRVYGFVSTGYNIGNAVIPVLLGWLVDTGRADAVFFALAALMIVAIATVGVARRPAASPAAAE
jgi:MFS family permease